jgi:hypothetical protein
MNSCLDPQLVGWMNALHVGAVQLRGAGGWLAGRGIGWHLLGWWCPAATRGLRLGHGVFMGEACFWDEFVFESQLVGWMTVLHVSAVQLRGAGGWLAGRGIGWRQLGRWCPDATRGLRLVLGVFMGEACFWDEFVFGSPAGWMDERSARRRCAATRGGGVVSGVGDWLAPIGLVVPCRYAGFAPRAWRFCW